MNAAKPRPYIELSFPQLEAEFEKARSASDRTSLKKLQRELTFRKKNRHTPALAAQVAEALDLRWPERCKDVAGTATSCQRATKLVARA